MELTTLSKNEWSRVTKDSKAFWDETSKISPRTAKVVDALKLYKSTMEKGCSSNYPCDMQRCRYGKKLCTCLPLWPT